MREKSIKNLIQILAVLVSVSSCTDFLMNQGNDSGREQRKKETTYYWYGGEKMTLTISDEYVNVVGNLEESEYLRGFARIRTRGSGPEDEDNSGGLVKLRINRPSTRSVAEYPSYSEILAAVREEESGIKVLPFIERASGKPVGTSDIFYVKLRSEDDTLMFRHFADSVGVGIVSDVPYTPQWYVMSIRESVFNNVFDASNAFYESGRFEAVDPAFMFDFRPASTVNDPMYSLQWGLKNTQHPGYDINVESAWDISKGNGVKIAILDSGVDHNHVDLAANIHSLSYDTSRNTSIGPLVPADNHGTHVAGIMAAVADNNTQVAGVAPQAKLMRVWTDLNGYSGILADFAAGINWAWRNGADIINNS